MSNDLEKFIAGNRDAFDDKMPPTRIWENVEAGLAGKVKKKNTLSPIIKWSTATAAMLLIGSMFYFKFNDKQNEGSALVETSKTELPGVSEVNEFAKMILLKQEELKALSKEQPALYRKFSEDIIQLDSSYKALKDQLSVTPNKEMLVEAMIQNLELQLSVLNQQLSIIKQIKQSKEDSYEKKFPEI